jgi:SprA family protein
MLLQSPIRIAYQPVESLDPVALRRESTDEKQSFARVFGGARRTAAGDQAAVVEFGARALDLARSEGSLPDDSAAGTAGSSGASGATGSASAAGAASTAALSAFATATLNGAAPRTVTGGGTASEDTSDEDGSNESSSVKGTVFAADQLSESDDKQLIELRQRDREVHAHEQAHKNSGGAFAGSIRLSYQMGPDGKRYAVEGSVPIDVSPVAGDPAATLRKMEVVHRAATAPTSPSGPDRQVAAQAQRMTQQARAQIAAERYSQARDLLAPA